MGSKTNETQAERLRGLDKSKTLKTWQDWKAEGAEIYQSGAAFPGEDRETSLSFIGDGNSEVTTAHYQWQKRLEELGCVPEAITVFGHASAEIRYYPNVPRKFIRMPSAGRGKD